MEKNNRPNDVTVEPNRQENKQPNAQQKRSGRIKMLLILAVCLAPVVASYFTYYVIKPTTRNNYGTLLDAEKYPMPRLGAVGTDGKSAELTDYKGRWLLMQVDSGECNQVCKVKVLDMRQVRLTLGKEKERVERVWLVIDDKPIAPVVAQMAEGMHVLRVKPEAVKAWLPADGAPSDYLFVIDPLGNLILRYPKAANLYKLKADLTKLLTASSIG